MLQCLVREQTYRGVDADSIDSSGGESVVKLKTQFETKTVKLYTRILEYQIRLARQFTRHRFFRYMRNLAAVDGWPGKLEEIKTFEEQGARDLAVIDAMRLKFITLEQSRSFSALFKRLETNQKEMTGMITRMEAQAIEARNKEEEERRLEVWKQALEETSTTLITKPHEIPKPLDYKRKVEDRKGKVVDGTCGWLYRDPAFEQFVQSDSHDLLWIHGNPGKGKSMLALSLIDKLSAIVNPTSHDGDSNAPRSSVSYYFFAHDDSRLRTAVSMERSLLFQVIENRPDLVGHILQDLEISRNELFSQPEALQTGWRVFTEMIQASSPTECSYFIVDALDECDLDSRTEWVGHLVAALNRVDQGSQPHKLRHKMKWIITSRSNEFDIREALGGENKFKNICLEDHGDDIETDVLHYIDVQMATFPSRHLESEKKAIRQTLLENCEGTFLWVWLACEQIRKTRPGLVAAVLKKPVKGLDAFYQRMLDSIEEDAHETAKDILQVVLNAERPLNLRELAIASNVVPSDDDDARDAMAAYLELCGSLLIIEQSTDIVTLVHKSARIFLTQNIKKEPSKSLYAMSFSKDEGHLVLAARCYHYLHCGALAAVGTENPRSRDLNTIVAKVTATYPFFDYATTYWTHHARKASSKSNESRVQDIFLQDTEFLEPGDSELRSVWCRISESGSWFSSSHTALHVACRGGIPPLVSHLLARGDSIDQADKRGWTALHHAAWNGYEDVVTLLIQKGAKTDLKDNHGANALHLVAQRGYDSIAKLLCREEISDTLLYAINENNKTPMHIAVQHVREGVVRVLAPLMAASSIDPVDNEGHTPLHYAACSGDLKGWLHKVKDRGGGVSASASSSILSKSILKIRPIVNADNDEAPEEKFYDPIIRILLDHGAKVEATDPFGQTPLHLAVFVQQLSAILLLAKHGKCDLSPRNNADFTPLMWAADNSLKETVKILLKLGADPSVATGEGCVPLLFAAREQNVDVMRLFLQFGADPCAAAEDGESPLYISCQHGPVEAAKLLIEKAADLTVRYKISGDTPLLAAIGRKNQHETAKALIAAGADISLSNDDHCTPLHMAAYQGGESLTKLLISMGADISGRTVKQGLTPFACAVNSKCYPVAQFLADAGSDMHVPCPGGGTLLHLAAFQGPPETVRLLLDARLDPNAMDDKKARPLHDAAAGGSLGVIKLLVGAGADLTSICEEYGGSALDISKKKKEQDEKWKRKDENEEAEGDVAEYLEGLMSTGLPDRSKPVIEGHKEDF